MSFIILAMLKMIWIVNVSHKLIACNQKLVKTDETIKFEFLKNPLKTYVS